MRNGITKHQDPVVVANTIYMAGGGAQSSYLLVEGPSDFQLFNRFIAQKGWSIFWLEGKMNVATCVRILVERGFLRFQALLDNDPFDHLDCPGPVVYTDLADLESELLNIPHVCERLMISSALRSHGGLLEANGHLHWWGFLTSFIRPWTLARAAVVDAPSKPPLRDIPLERIVSRDRLELDLDRVRQELSLRMRGTDALSPSILEDAELTLDDLDRFHCGHHLTSAAAWISWKALDAPKLGATHVEDKLRSIVDFEDFIAIPAVHKLQELAHKRGDCLWGSDRCPACNAAREIAAMAS